MPSIPHFYNLSLRNQLVIYKGLRSGRATTVEKIDGVFIGFRFETNVDRFGTPIFPPKLSFRSYNSPWVGTGTEYLVWAGSDVFSVYFAQVIADLSRSEDFVRNLTASMLRTNSEIVTAELMSPSVMEDTPTTVKMIRTAYPKDRIRNWPRYGYGDRHFLLFHKPNLGFKMVPGIYQTIDGSEYLNKALSTSIDELVSTKGVNRQRRLTLQSELTIAVQDFYEDVAMEKGIEGVVIEHDGLICKVVHPLFSSWKLNKYLFKGD